MKLHRGLTQLCVGLALVVMLVGCPKPTPTPIAMFSVDKYIGEPPLQITFTDKSFDPSTGTNVGDGIVTRLWDMGDGTTSTQASFTHTYTEPGIYTVSLTVTNPDGAAHTFSRQNGLAVLDPDRVQGTEAGEERTVAGIRFVWIPAGTFRMGNDPTSYADVEYFEEDAQPQHQVTLTHGFWMSKYEIRQDQWSEVMSYNPSLFNDLPEYLGYPVDSVSWYACQNYVDKLNALDVGLFRLPTEAEWEYACRAGTTSLFYFGESLEGLAQHVSSSLSSPYSTKPVGSFEANPWGLHDVHGNLWEWVLDFYASDSYTEEAQVDPFGPSAGSYNVVRGGSFRDPFFLLTSVTRTGYAPSSAYYFIGCRLVLQ